MTSINYFSNIILDYSNVLDEDKKEEYLKILVTESERISRLINQVLDIENMQSEGTPPSMEPVNMAEIVQSAHKGMSQLFVEKGAEVKYGPNYSQLIQGDLSSWVILGNRDRLTQVVVNLLSNALKFCNAEKGLVEIELVAKAGFVVLSIRDNGPGIPGAMLNHIFEKFTQLHSKELGKPQGTGLGLSLSYDIIKAHGGELKVETKEGEGSTFTIQIPLS